MALEKVISYSRVNNSSDIGRTSVVGVFVAVIMLEVVKSCVGEVDGLLVGEGDGMFVKEPVEVRVPVVISVISLEGLVVGIWLGFTLTGADVYPNLQPATNPPGTSHVSGQGSLIAQHPR